MIEPDNLPILHKLLALYQKANKWVSRSSTSCDDRDRRYRSAPPRETYFTMGQIASIELLDRGTALEMFGPSRSTRTRHSSPRSRTSTGSHRGEGLGRPRADVPEDDRARGGASRVEPRLPPLQAAHHRPPRSPRRFAGATESIKRAVKLSPTTSGHGDLARAALAHRAGARRGRDHARARAEGAARSASLSGALRPARLAERPRSRALRGESAMKFLDVNHPRDGVDRELRPAADREALARELGPEGVPLSDPSGLDPTLTGSSRSARARDDRDRHLAPLAPRARDHPGPALKGMDWLGGTFARAAQILGVPAPRLYARRSPGGHDRCADEAAVIARVSAGPGGRDARGARVPDRQAHPRDDAAAPRALSARRSRS